MTWSESFIGYSGRSVEKGLESILEYIYSSIYDTGSRSMTLEAFDVTGVIRQW